MSTSINLGGLPDVHEPIEKLANQFFKSLPGNFASQPNPQQAAAEGHGFNEVSNLSPDNGLPDNLHLFDTLTNTQPPRSVAGSGVSPSAINQGNAVDLKDPQTSFADPNLGTSKPSLGGGGISPFGLTGTPPTGKVSTNPYGYETTGYNDLSASPSHLQLLPYQNEQPFEVELRKVLTNIGKPEVQPQLPYSAPSAPSETSFYFVKDYYSPSVTSNEAPTPSHGISGIVQPPFDVNVIRRDFPILQEQVNGKQLIWLDNAATTQKPKQVIDRISYFYEHENSNIHRAAHELAARATDAYEGAREKVRAFLNARSVNEIIFVRGATEAINLVAKSWGEQYLQAGDEIIVSHLEHHANIVPWQQLAVKKGLKIKVIPVDDDGQIILGEYLKLLGPKTRLVSFTQVSNALGTVTPAHQIVQLAHAAGAKVLVDGAQSVSHMRVDVQALNADWFVFSGHKVFAPTGIGVLYGKEGLLNETQPWQGGGNMIVDVTFEHTQYHKAPGRFEAGTGNIADAVGLGAAIDYVTRLGMDAIAQYEHYLLDYATGLLKQVPGLRLIGTARDKASVLSFVLAGYKTGEVGAALNEEGIAVRSGHHCAQPILRRFGVEGTVRPSLAFYNTCAEVDVLVNTLHRLKQNK